MNALVHHVKMELRVLYIIYLMIVDVNNALVHHVRMKPPVLYIIYLMIVDVNECLSTPYQNGSTCIIYYNSNDCRCE